MKKTNSVEVIPRFSFGWRIQHLLLALGVTGLALTGLALRYYDTSFGRFLIDVEGGLGMRGLLHRIFASMLGAATVWHVMKVVFSREGHEDFLALMPEKGDRTRWIKTLRSKLSGGSYEADWGRYTFGQKVQYWMVACGVLAMIVSGVILLFGHRSVAFLPKWLVDAVRVIHGGQGVELMVFIVLWHLYSTHLAPGRFPMDTSWITGNITLDQLKLNHKREYRRLLGEETADE